MTKLQTIIIRINETQKEVLKSDAKRANLSVNQYINFLLSKQYANNNILYDERNEVDRRKEIRTRVSLEYGEAEILKKSAQENNWSLPKEVRYRVISTISKVGKISGEEMQFIRKIQGNINVLGANINRIIREGRVVDLEGKDLCEKLIMAMKELREQINKIEDSSKTRFTMK